MTFWLLLLLWSVWATIVVVGFARLPRPRGPKDPAAAPPAPSAPKETTDSDLVLRAPTALAVREPLPIVLIHGFFGWDEIRIGRRTHVYFKGVRERLVREGIDVRAVRLPPAGTIEERARELARQLAAVPARKVHLVAHSMGGIDARFALTCLGVGERAATLITIGSPHKGTPLAELGARLGSTLWKSLGRALEDLSPARMASLDEELVDVDSVRYRTIVVRPKDGVRGVCAPLVPSYLWLERNAGKSDGIVPVRSQQRGTVLGALDTDHWGAIGWTSFDAPGFYARLAKHLANDEPLDAFLV